MALSIMSALSGRELGWHAMPSARNAAGCSHDPMYLLKEVNHELPFQVKGRMQSGQSHQDTSFSRQNHESMVGSYACTEFDYEAPAYEIMSPPGADEQDVILN